MQDNLDGTQHAGDADTAVAASVKHSPIRRFVGGPLDGQDDFVTTSDVVVIEGETGRYVRWWDMPADYDPDWFIHDKPEPAKPERYMRWQEEGAFEEHPAIRWLRDTIREAASSR
jgi:hypothetical protein